MKLSKKNRTLQRAIARALASGKTLGGLLAGLTAAVFTGCRENSTHVLMGEVAEPQHESNTTNERRKRNTAIQGKYIIEPEETTNKPNEKKDGQRLLGDVREQ